MMKRPGVGGGMIDPIIWVDIAALIVLCRLAILFLLGAGES